MKKQIVLKGKGFIIRPYRKGDYISLAKNANNKKIAKNLQNGFPSPYTEKDAKEWISKVLKSYKKEMLNFVIDVDGSAAGSIGSTSMKDFMMGFGYWLGEKYWGRGIASEAVKLYLKYILDTYKNIQRIEAFTFSWNQPSQKVLLKNGLKFEGVLRKTYLKNGKLVDQCMFSKLRNEK
jgi:RimJ/RimL family protein N-acetyltransferase